MWPVHTSAHESGLEMADAGVVQDLWERLREMSFPGHTSTAPGAARTGPEPLRCPTGENPTPRLLAVFVRHSYAILALIVGASCCVLAYSACGSYVVTGGTWLPVVRFWLATGGDADRTNWSGYAPLHYAASKGEVAVAKWLLDHGADPNVRDNKGRTPLHEAADAHHTAVARLLLAHGADPNARDNRNSSPLHAAVSWRGAPIVKALLDAGADVNAEDDYGQTPLYLAARYDATEVSELLLAAGADYRMDIAAILGDTERVKELLEAGVDLDSRGVRGKTPLFEAALKSQVEVLRLLRDHSADVNARDDSGVTPLHVASGDGHVEVVRCLLEYGVDPNADALFGTPLHWATAWEQPEVVRGLLAHGADANARNDDGGTPLSGAIRNGNTQIAALLRAHGGRQ